MKRPDEPFTKKPSTVDEFIRCLIWEGWDPGVAFDQGSRNFLNLGPALIRDSIRMLRKKKKLSRYTYALCKIVRLSQPDDVLKQEWRTNFRLLRALLYTPAVGTDLQKEKLLEIARNNQVVKAMRYALGQERKINRDKIEAGWIAVLYEEGSSASVREANRFNKYHDPETQNVLRTCLKR